MSSALNFARDLVHYIRDPLNTFAPLRGIQTAHNLHTGTRATGLRDFKINQHKNLVQDYVDTAEQQLVAENYRTSSCLRAFHHSGDAYLAFSDMSSGIHLRKLVRNEPSK